MTKFPTEAALISASPSDVGLAILVGLVRIHGDRDKWQLNGPRFVPVTNLISDVVGGITEGTLARAAAGDAIAWLSSHDLVCELHQRGSGSSGTVIPTPLGYEVATAAAKSSGAAAQALRVVDLIPSQLRLRLLAPLVAGDFDVAITNAFKAVEVRMRERAQLSSGDFGSRLARKFFAKCEATRLQREDRRGELSDEERLFEGLFGMYRDRAVHEAPHVDSMEYAMEVIIAAAHLLRVVEAAIVMS